MPLKRFNGHRLSRKSKEERITKARVMESDPKITAFGQHLFQMSSELMAGPRERESHTYTWYNMKGGSDYQQITSNGRGGREREREKTTVWTISFASPRLC